MVCFLKNTGVIVCTCDAGDDTAGRKKMTDAEEMGDSSYNCARDPVFQMKRLTWIGAATSGH